MDNKTYLDQIAVKAPVKSGPIISPFIIKIIAAGLVTLITLLIVGSVISSSNAKTTQIYERVYLRIVNLASDDEDVNPLYKYLEKVKNSHTRTIATSFLTTMKSTNVSLTGLANNIGIKPAAISKKITEEEAVNMTELEAELNDAVLTGTLDRTYIAKLQYQISILLAYEQDARLKTPNQQFATLLDQSIEDLTIYLDQIEKRSQE